MRKYVKAGMIFPGQGAQYPGMGKSLYDAYPAIRDYYKKADEVLGFSIKELCFEGSAEELGRTENTQPALLLTSYVSYVILRDEYAIQPLISAGHSLGELTALTSADVITFEDAVRLVRLRGELTRQVNEKRDCGMAVIKKLPRGNIEELCALAEREFSDEGETAVIANFNYYHQYVISGSRKAITFVCDKAEEMGGESLPLNISTAFHSPLQKEAAVVLKKELKKITYHPFSFPVIANLTALPYPNSSVIPHYLSEHLTQPVRWIETMEYLKGLHPPLLIEAAPGNTLWKLLGKHSIGAPVIKIDVAESFDDITAFSEEQHTGNFLDALLTKAVSLPSLKKDDSVPGLVNDLFRNAAAYEKNEPQENKDKLLTQLALILQKKGFQESEIKRELDFLFSLSN